LNKKKILFFILNKKVASVFLTNHIKYLNTNFNISFLSSEKTNFLILDNRRYKNTYINISRSYNITNFILNLLKTYFFFKKNNFDLIFSLHPKIGLIISLLKSFLKLKNLHIFTGQVWVNKKHIIKYLLKLIDHFIIFKSTYLLADSSNQISFLKENNFDVTKIKLLHNGSIAGVNVNKFYKSTNNKIKFCQKFNIDKSSTIILYLGRINKDKGIIDLLDAYCSMQFKYNLKCILVLVGDQEMDIDKYLNMDPKLFKIFYFPFNKNIQYFYSIADIFCNPSHREGFGMTVIEASSSSIPVLVSNINGLKNSYILNKTAINFKVGNINDLINKLFYLIDNKTLRNKLGENGKKFVSKYFDQEDVSKYLYNHIIEITS